MILAVVRTHFARLKRDRAALVLSFIVPIVFFSVFASIFGGARNATPRIRLIVVDEDRSENSRRFTAALGSEKALNILLSPAPPADPAGPFDRAGAEQAVRAGTAPLALILPKGFGSAPVGFGPATPGRPKLLLLADTSDPIAPQVVTGLIQKVSMTSMPDAMAQMGIDQVDRWGGGLTAEQRARLEENVRNLRQSSQSAGAGSAAALRVGARVPRLDWIASVISRAISSCSVSRPLS